VFSGAARNFLMNQVAAAGPEGLGLNYVLESLSTLLVTGTRGYFSAHIFSPQLNKRIQAAIFAYLTSQRAAGPWPTPSSRPSPPAPRCGTRRSAGRWSTSTLAGPGPHGRRADPQG